MKPMLAQSASTDDLIRLVNDPAYSLQQKLDGYRIMVVVDDGKLTVLNRDGKRSSTDLATDVRADIASLPDGKWVLDCELVQGVLWVFDLPESPAISPAAPFDIRDHLLKELFKVWAPTSAIKRLPTATSHKDKHLLAQAVLTSGGEGIIAKACDALYQPGVRGPAQLKVKFYQDVDCVVTDLRRDGKDNIGLGLWDNGQLIDIGEVTALAGDGPRVQVGNVVCIRYLYATQPDRPRLYQPTTPRIRDDKSADQCTLDQLRFSDKRVIKDW